MMSPDGCTTVQLPGTDERRISHNGDGLPGFAGHCAIAECRVQGNPGFAAFVYAASLPGHTFAVTNTSLAVIVNNLRQRGVEAVSIVRDDPPAGGFHLTLGACSSPALLSVEFSAHDCSIVEVKAREDRALPIHRTHPDDPDDENTLPTADIAIRRIGRDEAQVSLGGKAHTVLAKLLERPEEVAVRTITDLAASLDVSASTLTRLSTKLGYAGFADFQSVFRDSLAERHRHFYRTPVMGGEAAARETGQ
jgi:hypothetical protein